MKFMLSSVQKSKHKTYAPEAGSTNISLLHSDITHTRQENDDDQRTIQTRIYRSARSVGAYLIDITSCKGIYTDQQSMKELKKQHPKVHACMALGDGPTRYLEVYVTDDNDVNDIKKNGITFPDAKIQVLPCRAINALSEIIKLKLTHLPMFVPNEVLAGLTKSLEMFGNIIDIGIATENTTGFFMGSGYAVIDTYQANDVPPESKYQPLSHQISWMDSTTDVFRATWNNMPTRCCYCHKNGHSKFECEASKARVLCYPVISKDIVHMSTLVVIIPLLQIKNKIEK